MSDALFRCLNIDECREPDDRLSKFLNKPLDLPRVLPPDTARGGLDHEVKCPHCETDTNIRVCPECHSDLADQIDRLFSPVINIFGDIGSGKSIFIAVLVNTLSLISEDLIADFRFQCNHTQRNYRRIYYEPVYVQGRVLPPTRSRLADTAIRQPLIYRAVTRLYWRGLYPLRTSKVANLGLYDSSGDDQADPETVALCYRAIPFASAFIVLIDPLSFEDVRSRVSSRAQPSVVTEAQRAKGILDNLSDCYLRSGANRSRQRVKVPTAFVVTKADTLRELTDFYGPDLAQVFTHARHRKGFDLRHGEATSEALKRLLCLWGGADIVKVAKERFARHAFFGISSLGEAPEDGFDEAGNPVRIIPRGFQPMHVEYPFLWVLHQLGLLSEE
jgi:hypothetical protein